MERIRNLREDKDLSQNEIAKILNCSQTTYSRYETGDLNLEYIFEKLFCEESGQGYPRERAVPEKRNKQILDGVREAAFRNLLDILKDLDPELVKGAVQGENFSELFFAHCRDEKIADYVREILG